MLVEFALFIVASVVCVLKPAKLSGAAIERLFGRGLNYLFVLSLVVVVAGIYISLPVTNAPSQAQNASLIQQTGGDESPAINSNRDVNVSYGVAPKANDKQPATKSQAKPSTVSAPQTVEQTTKGDRSLVVNSQGNVSINYGQ